MGSKHFSGTTPYARSWVFGSWLNCKECYDSIEADPRGYQIRKGDFRHVMLRKFPYRVVYEVEGQDVFIYRVIHVKRKPHPKYGP